MSKDLTHELPDKGNKVPTTEPMLEAILAKVNDLASRVDEGFAEINVRIDTLNIEVREIKRNQRVFNDQLLHLQGSQRDTEDRLDNLERKAS